MHRLKDPGVRKSLLDVREDNAANGENSNLEDVVRFTEMGFDLGKLLIYDKGSQFMSKTLAKLLHFEKGADRVSDEATRAKNGMINVWDEYPSQ